MSQKSIKGHAIAQHLAYHPLPDSSSIDESFPDEELGAILDQDASWMLYFDGALNSKGCGIGIVLLSPEKVCIPQAYQLAFPATNNIAEYEALLTGLKVALSLGVKELRIVGDSQLILRQSLNKYQIRDPKLKPY